MNELRLKIKILLLVITKTGLAKFIGFTNTLRVLKLFSFDKDWANYLINREKSNYYKISKILFSNLSPNLKVLDIGCGPGSLLKECRGSITAIDISRLNLFLAKYFFAKKNDILINHNAEKSLPFRDNYFDVVHLNDTFQYIKNKEKLIKEAARILRRNGLFVVVHTHKYNLYKNIIGISPYKLKTLLARSGFSSSSIFSDEISYLNLIVGDKVKRNSVGLDKTDKLEAYTFFASKNNKLNSQFNLTGNDLEYIFISPHLDDAVLSSGNLISKLADAGKKIKLITIFTRSGSKPYPVFGTEFVKSCGYNSAEKLFNDRVNEDIKALKYLKVQHIHLDFVDAAFRKNSGGNPIYKFKSLFSGKISGDDYRLIARIRNELKKMIGKKSVIFVPIGIGGHADHVLVREVVQKFTNKKIYWEDFPYNSNLNSIKRLILFSKVFKNYELPRLKPWYPQATPSASSKLLNSSTGKPVVFLNNYKKILTLRNADNRKKYKAINFYKSQLETLFPNGVIANIDEQYYLDTTQKK